MPGPEQHRPEKQAYLRISRGVLDAPGPNREANGQELVRRCLEELRWNGKRERADQGNFPPRLFVLLATKAFQPFEDLLGGIRKGLEAEQLADVPLIGCSVAGILTEEQTLLQGAALVCVASRFVQACVEVADHIAGTANPYDDATLLCERLDLHPPQLNTKRNSFLLCFLPGFVVHPEGRTYHAPEAYRALRDATGGLIPMVGGVAADDFRREHGWVFADGQVYADRAVVALVDTDLRFGIGLKHGVHATGRFLHANKVSADGHHITSFGRISGDRVDVIPAATVVEDCDGRMLLGAVAPEDEGERVVFFPLPEEGQTLFVAHGVREGDPLEVLTFDSEVMRNTPANTIQQAVHDAEIDLFHLAFALRFPCAARFKRSDQIDLDVGNALAEMRGRFPGLPIVAGLMFGEIGQGHSGRSLLRNWSVSNLLLSDELRPRSLHRRGYEALSRLGKKMSEAGSESMPTVISAALDALVEAGFPGGMISLLFRDKDSFVIVAQDARGEGWKRIVEPTKRWADDVDILDVDILSLVAKERRARFVPDARKSPHDDPLAVDLAKVISYFVAPLIAPTGEVVGALQVDLGDMSNLPADRLPQPLQSLLEAFAGQIATGISLAIQMHESRLSELFDQAVKASLVKTCIKDATQTFLDTITAEGSPLEGLLMHVRLLDSSKQNLELLGGAGPYFRVAQQHRPSIPLDDPSPTAAVFRGAHTVWVNDLDHDPEAIKYQSSLPETSPFLEAYRSVKSSAGLLIRAKAGDAPIGVIIVGSFEPWFFSESVRRSMHTLGERFHVALQHAKNAEAETQRTRDTRFLLKVTPPLGEGSLEDNLCSHVVRIARTANAEIASFFLWDEETEQFTLCAPHGWHDESMKGKASYRLNEGLTGTLAEKLEVRYIPDVAAEREAAGCPGPGKYEHETFGVKTPGWRYELIAIPLALYPITGGLSAHSPFQRRLGILTMQNAIGPDGPESLFTVRDRWLLFQVQRDLSAFLAASLAHEDTLKRQEMERRVAEFSKLLLAPVSDTYELTRRVCQHLAESCHLQGCALYLPDDRDEKLCRAGPPCFPVCQTPDEVVLRGAQEFDVDSVLGRVFTEKRPFVWSADAPPKEPLDDSVLWARPFVANTRIASVLILPICELGKPSVGVLTAWNIHDRERQVPRPFTLWDRDTFDLIAEHLARALEQQRSAREAQWLLFSGTVRTNLAHLVRNRALNARTVLDSLSQRLDTMGLNEEQRTAIASPEKGLPSVRDDCDFLVVEMERLEEAGDRAEGRPYQGLSLQAPVEEALARCKAAAHRQGIVIEAANMADIWLRGDQEQLAYAFQCLIENSIKYTSPTDSRRRIEINADSRPDAADSRPDAQRVRIHIRDYGRAMTPQKAAELSTAPRRRDGWSSDRRVRVGVAYAKFVFALHGGQLEFELPPEGGVDAVVTLVTLPSLWRQ